MQKQKNKERLPEYDISKSNVNTIELSIFNPVSSPVNVDIYTEPDTLKNSCRLWYTNLPKTVTIKPKSSENIVLTINMPTELKYGSYYSYVYVEEQNQNQIQKSEKINIKTNVRYAVNNIFTKGEVSDFNIDLANFSFYKNTLKFDINNLSEFILKSDINVQFFSKDGNCILSKDIKSRVMPYVFKVLSINDINDLVCNNSTKIIISITDQNNQVYVFEKNIKYGG
jgi:hypothetical protein